MPMYTKEAEDLPLKQDVFTRLIWMHIMVSWVSMHKLDLSGAVSCIIQLLFKMSCFWISSLSDKSFIKVSARFDCIDIMPHLVPIFKSQ